MKRPPVENVVSVRLPLSTLSPDGVARYIHREIAEGRGGWVLTANMHYVSLAKKSVLYAELFRKADLVVADGLPLLWIAFIEGCAPRERVAGADLVWVLAGMASETNRRIAFVGDEEEIADKARYTMVSRYPGLVIPGVISPPVHEPPRERELRLIIDFLDSTRPDIIYVALGAPKQEFVIAELKDRYPGTWWIGIGGSLKFVSGEQKRAPIWIQGFGLEWLYRLIREPKRLFRRYLLEDAPVFARLLVTAIRVRFGRD